MPSSFCRKALSRKPPSNRGFSGNIRRQLAQGEFFPNQSTYSQSRVQRAPSQGISGNAQRGRPHQELVQLPQKRSPGGIPPSPEEFFSSPPNISLRGTGSLRLSGKERALFFPGTLLRKSPPVLLGRALLFPRNGKALLGGRLLARRIFEKPLPIICLVLFQEALYFPEVLLVLFYVALN